MKHIKEIDSLISAMEAKLLRLDEQRKVFQNQIDALKHKRDILINQTKSVVVGKFYVGDRNPYHSFPRLSLS